MAFGEIKNNVRPCYLVGDKVEKALFHGFFEKDDVYVKSGHRNGNPLEIASSVVALVEFANGEVRQVHPNFIQFADGGSFNEYSWLPLNNNEEEGT